MRPDFGVDSLDQIELAMALEEEFGIEIVGGFGEDEATLILRIACRPYALRWIAPEPRDGWPAIVRVIGEDRRRVLCSTDHRGYFGVGCRGLDGIVDAVRVYPSLQRALFAFARHECSP
jgi:hypothetical protein